MKVDFEIVSGGVQPETARAVAKIIGTKVLPVQLKEFPNGERYARLEQTVRNKSLFMFCTCATSNSYSLNDALFEAFIIADAAKRASAKEISIVLPLLPYSRQDRKARTREPITSALVLSMLKQAGIERVITVDLHSTQIQAAFSGPFENLSARKLISNKIKKYRGAVIRQLLFHPRSAIKNTIFAPNRWAGGFIKYYRIPFVRSIVKLYGRIHKKTLI